MPPNYSTHALCFALAAHMYVTCCMSGLGPKPCTAILGSGMFWGDEGSR